MLFGVPDGYEARLMLDFGLIFRMEMSNKMAAQGLCVVLDFQSKLSRFLALPRATHFHIPGVAVRYHGRRNSGDPSARSHSVASRIQRLRNLSGIFLKLLICFVF